MSIGVSEHITILKLTDFYNRYSQLACLCHSQRYGRLDIHFSVEQLEDWIDDNVAILYMEDALTVNSVGFGRRLISRFVDSVSFGRRLIFDL